MKPELINLTPNKILIVDDVPDNLRLLSTTLTEKGYQIRCAKSGKIALIGAENDLPNLILLDINMPEMNGYEVCQKLKANPKTADIPIIFLSAQDNIQDKVTAFEIGGADFISKPFRIQEVLARVKNQLNLQAAKAEIRLLNQELETRVANRTLELETANKKLAIINQQLQEKILEKDNFEKKLLYDALHDGLTGLPNRSLFMKRIQIALEKSKSDLNYKFAILFIDLDRFKIVNDSLGHLIGDHLLIACAKCLEKCLSDQDIVARIGGDEFTILLENIDTINNAIAVADEILTKFKRPFKLGAHVISTTASIGIVLGTTKYQQSSELLRDADTAMYRAKGLGKARHEIFNEQMHVHAIQRLELENNFREALKLNQFVLFYQPIIHLTTGQLVGFEALVRWQHPTKGLIYPDDFIPLAEETGLIIPLTKWVFNAACHQLNIWQNKFPHFPILNISINIAADQLKHPNFLKIIDKILEQNQVRGSSIKLEITESMLMQDSTDIIDLLSEIKAREIDLCIDDFGKGFSSLSYLPRFPIDILKIDRSFVSCMDCDENNFEVVRTIISLAHSLGIKVVSEGIEKMTQLEQLHTLGSEFGQGFFFSRPLNSESAELMISSNLIQLELENSQSPSFDSLKNK
ncbi:diguanylate cyclase (GGDEF) domain-containing protein [Xenococcus sp. PCC 7305]|uniref:two-component system response regulator n=1 Tax=Xenococcus sp. PCC 7305 TaxID=102125 RepID=UPI0002ACD4F8|nr:GGDEF domain-containing response regulator [Xenococcus sp. PCC 7305]ELS03159.1 diguanylate cyclase (GGDEF) domain-containing protein [Xenococcus sp. PCC 7305]